MIAVVALSILTGFPALDALASDDSSFRTHGATIRLVADAPNAGGEVRGAVLFDLEPGWKTYWIDPGEAGLAPVLRFTVAGAEAPAALFFPAPIRFMEDGSSVNGYDEPLAIAFVVEGQTASTLTLDLRAGLCLDLCVPISARLTTDLSEPVAGGDIAAVERAFLAVPDDRGTSVEAHLEDEALVVGAPQGTPAASDLFVESAEGWSFGPARNEGSAWRVPIRTRPAEPSAGKPLLPAVIADGGRGELIQIELP